MQIAGYAYFVCTTYVATAISSDIPSIFVWFYMFEMDYHSVDKSDAFLSLGIILRQ
jgi:hypothetical protein